MAYSQSTHAVGALLAALLLGCFAFQAADAAFATSNFILAPVPAMASNPQPRQEIRDLMANKYSATLFIRSLLNMQAIGNYTQLDSYMALAGIHGANVQYDRVSSGLGWGYCKHGQPFFGPWHTPYLSIIEQALFEEANRLAGTYKTSDAAQYVTAARNMRLPFWDTARAKSTNTAVPTVPAIFTQASYTVTLENGTSSTVKNPLYSWTIPSGALSYYKIDPARATTTRGPVDWVTNYQNNVLQDLRRDTYQMFGTSNFTCFVAGGCSEVASGSLENNHNWMHVTIGGYDFNTGEGGHMSFIDLAAYDPIFFLHHCNVDRQMAIWQGIYPTSRSMDSIRYNPAYPFRRTSSGWWRTNDLMNVYTKTNSTRWGYYYPELAKAITPTQLKDKVKQLYDDSMGQPVTTATFSSTSTVDGTTSVSLAGTSTTTATRRTRAGKRKTTRRTRRVVVRAGSVRLVTPRSRAGVFMVKHATVDISDALAKLKAAHPEGLSSVSIVAVVTPTRKSAAANQPTEVSLGTPIITTTINGKVVATTAPNPPATATTAAKNNNAAAADLKLFAGVGEVKAVVAP